MMKCGGWYSSGLSNKLLHTLLNEKPAQCQQLSQSLEKRDVQGMSVWALQLN